MKSSKILILLVFVLAGLVISISKSQKKDKSVSPTNKQQLLENTDHQSNQLQTVKTKPQTQTMTSDFDLQQAVEHNDHASIINHIDQGKIDVDHKDESGMTLLMQALDYGQTQFAYALIERGAKLDVSDKSGTNLLTQAVLAGETKITQMALKKGGNPNAQLDLIGSGLLMYAAQEGLDDEIELLIQYGADINHQNHRGETALMWASDMGQYSTVELLLKNNAQTSLKNKNGHSAIDLAKKRGLNQLVKILGAGT